MTEVETDLDGRYDNVDVDDILERCQNRVPLTFSTSKRYLYQAPEFIKRLPATEEVEEGSTVSFSCKVVGFPEPDVTWYKEDDVIGSESRAKLDSGEAGVHSITIADISKCDAGIYKIQASNLEGSSKSMLYISVKAKSKLRNRKNPRRGRKSRPIACAPMFPAIIEHVAEEQKEMLAVERQPESPLTPIYCTISRKAPVIWPAFLGEWAYNTDDVLHKDDLEDIRFIDDDEEVFEDEETEVKSPYNLTFVSKAYAELKSDKDNYIQESERSVISKPGTHDAAKHRVSLTAAPLGPRTVSINSIEIAIRSDQDTSNDKICDINDELKPLDRAQEECSLKNKQLKSRDQDLTRVDVCSKSLAVCQKKNDTDVCDKLNNNDKGDEDRNDLIRDEITRKVNQKPSNLTPQQEAETKVRICEPETVSVICVHRSYAKGDTTSSVARRSPSPFSRSMAAVSGSSSAVTEYRETYDTTALQNMNNERLLQNMTHQGIFYKRISGYFRSASVEVTWEDLILEMVLFVCASTFLALCFDVPPTTFIINILIALFVRFVLSEVFNDI